MNVVVVAPRLPPNCDGVGDHAHALAQALAACGHDVTALTAGNAITHQSYRTVVLDKSWGWRSALRAMRFLHGHKPGRVLLEYTPFLFGGASPAPLLIGRACRALGIPCAVIAHEIFYGNGSAAVSSPAKRRYFAWRDALVLRSAARIAVPNVERRDRISARLPALQGRIDVIPIAANVEPQGSYVRKASPGGPFQIVAFGVVMQRRRFETAIRALAELRRSIDARLTILGRIFDYGYADECRLLARGLGVAEYVTFTDSLSPAQITAHLSCADAAVHTTVEGSTRSSGSLLALLAHALPIVAVRTPFDDPCFEDVEMHVGDSPQFVADALSELAEHPAQARDLGDRGARAYRTAFDWRAVARALAS